MAAVGHFQPVGVMRVGSREERRDVYARFLHAATGVHARTILTSVRSGSVMADTWGGPHGEGKVV